jgi:diguanylate cyclase (GGDEF)-like protein/PAS domain S-box-containing protein
MKKRSCKLDLYYLLDKLPAGVVVHNMDTSIEYTNAKALKILGLSWEQMSGKDAFSDNWDFINELGIPLEVKDYPVNKILESKNSIEDLIIGIRNPDASNKPTWVLVNGYIDTEKDEQKIIITFADVTREYAIPYKDVLDKAHDAIIITDASSIDEPDGPKILFVNEVFTKLTGYTPNEVIGKTPRILQGEETDRETLDRIRTALQNKQPIREVVYNYNKDDEGYWLDLSIFPIHMHRDNRVTHFVAIERDITDFKKVEIEYKTASEQDHLSGLLNRRGFELLSKELLSELRAHHDGYSIITMDIDHFKSINDTYSHATGDLVIQEISNIIHKMVRSRDLAVRLGGEEFAILFPYCSSKVACDIAERFRKKVEDLTVKTKNAEVSVTISVGVAEDKKSTNLDKTLANADKALYKAKESGRNRVVLI